MTSLRWLGCVVAVAVLLVGPARGADERAPFFVVYTSNELPGVKTAVELFMVVGTTPAVERVTISAPGGYLFTDKDVGEQVGLGFVDVRVPGLSRPRALIGTLVIADPALLASDAVLASCAPGSHSGAWQLVVNGRTSVTLPIAVDDLAAGGARLTVCLDPLRALSVVPTELDLALLDVRNPTSSGVYDWSTLVTDFGADGKPDPASVSELRADAPLPQTLTLHASYDRRTKILTVRGRLVAAGKPRRGVQVVLFNTGASVRSGLTNLGTARTTSTGVFTFHKRLAPKGLPRLVSAFVEVSAAACAAPSTAPKGCTSESMPGVDVPPVRIAVAG
jgi:hypothetical protein